MNEIQQFLKSFLGTDTPVPGIIEKPNGTIWLVNPDLTETQLPGGGALPDPSAEPDGDVLTTQGGAAVWLPGTAVTPGIWSDISASLSIDNGTVDVSNSYALAFVQQADPDGAFPSLTSIWVRVLYATYTGGGEAGALSMSLPSDTAAQNENYRAATCEISGFWATGGIGTWDAFGSAWWSSVDSNINLSGEPTFDVGDILICGMGTFPSF